MDKGLCITAPQETSQWEEDIVLYFGALYGLLGPVMF